MAPELIHCVREVWIEPEGRLSGEKRLAIIAGAGRLFETPGTLDEVVRHATGRSLSHRGATKRRW